MLIAPPVVPRPAKDEPGPRRISTCSVKKFSRTLTPASRMPSRKMSLRASKPRMKKRSPKALPPSPVPSVTPAVVSTADFSVVAFLSASTSLVSTVIDLRRVERSARETLPDACTRVGLVGRVRIGVGVAVGGRPPALGNGTAATCAGCARRAARRSAVRARTLIRRRPCDAAGRGRATGASTVTGGRLDCCASAPENEATAIRPATAVTFLPELFSML